MAKMTADEKMAHGLLVQQIIEQAGMIRTYRALRITVAVMPAIGNTMRARYVRVSVAQCSEQDKFKRKRGELIAAERMLEGQFFSVPLDGRTLSEIADLVAEFLGTWE